MNRYALLLITSMLLVGSNVGIGKSIVEFVPVPLFALLRFVIAMAVLWPLLRVAKLRRVKRDEWVNLFLQALFGTFGFTLLMLNGVQRTSAVAAGVWTLLLWYGLSASIFSFWLWMKGIRHVPGSLAGVFSAVLPVAAAIYGITFLGERPTLAHGFALACVIAGIGLASLKARRVPPLAS
ncbi:hypothetical protein LMG28614_05173 [Paraburkholderia ultramafica]|uniref:EamA domain-containing protein n=1 Tax=Paraburkholderia ultramafica TaxID=1544867 RepID=A0A6S7CXR5_9BURK|nr:DMT family transporter [Paraburkholderia ultramafica]CAB3800441.1 hypothetical protein LMG28614_05173 [Paraburkholderia ultramafica]